MCGRDRVGAYRNSCESAVGLALISPNTPQVHEERSTLGCSEVKVAIGDNSAAASCTHEVDEVAEEDAPVVDEAPTVLGEAVVVQALSAREYDDCVRCVLGSLHGTDVIER